MEKEPMKVYRDSATKSEAFAIEKGSLQCQKQKTCRKPKIPSKQRHENMHDSAYKTLELVHNLEHFVVEYALYPELRLIIALQDLTDELNRLLSLSDEKVHLSYDTTFGLVGFCVSVLTKHPLLNGNVCFPVAFMMHYRKRHMTHYCAK